MLNQGSTLQGSWEREKRKGGWGDTLIELLGTDPLYPPDATHILILTTYDPSDSDNKKIAELEKEKNRVEKLFEGSTFLSISGVPMVGSDISIEELKISDIPIEELKDKIWRSQHRLVVLVGRHLVEKHDLLPLAKDTQCYLRRHDKNDWIMRRVVNNFELDGGCMLHSSTQKNCQ